MAFQFHGRAGEMGANETQPVIARWDDLIARYPGSTWAKRADVIPPELREG
jgi:hypothetical protein